ncbi:MAG: sugar phosphate isomerase/epimerase family protein [Tissierellia bacterium]|nr:sugar phosphate isomerase/epimerase family protein [Tissierellia bacterium]
MWDFTADEIFDYVKANGLSGIEFWSQQMENQNLSAERIRELKSKFGTRLILHGKSWDLNLASINKNIRDLSVAEMVRDIDLAGEISAQELTIHPGRFSVNQDPESYYGFLRESLDQILDYASQREVPISIEIMEKANKEFIVDMASLKKLLGDDYGKVQVTLDVSHCDSTEEIYFLLDHLEEISKVHLSNRLKDSYHSPLDRGIFPMTEIIRAIAKREIPMVLEGMETGNTLFFLDRNIKFLKENNLL